MKQFKMVFPTTKAWDFCNWCYTNEIKVVMSWTEGGDFFDKAKIHAICQANDAGAEAVKNSEWKSFLTSNV